MRGRTLMALEKFPEAVFDFTWAIKLTEAEPQNDFKKLSEYHRFAGQSYFEMCQYQEAFDHFNCTVTHEQSGINYFNRGLVRSKQGLHENQKYLEANQDFYLSIKQYQDQKKEKAIEVYYCRYNLGINFRRLIEPKFEESILELKYALDLQPEKASCYNNLGLSYFEKNDYQKAISAFSAAIKLEPQSVHYNNRGLANFQGNNIQWALEDFEQAIKLNQTDDPTIYFNRGNTLLSQNMFNEALQDYDTAIKISPQNPKYIHAKGITFEALAAAVDKKNGRRRRFDLEDQSSTPREDSESLTVFLRKDFLEYSERAIKMYYQVLALDDNFNQSRFHLGKMFAQIYQYAEAVQHFSRVINNTKPSIFVKLNEEHHYCYLERGIVYLLMDEERTYTNATAKSESQRDSELKKSQADFISLAIRDFQDACTISQLASKDLLTVGDKQGNGKEWVKARISLANARLRDGMRGSQKSIHDAIFDFQRCKDDPEVQANVHDGLGQCFHAFKKFKDAIDEFDQALTLQQKNVDFLTNRAKCYFDFKFFDKCINDLDAAIKLNEHDPLLLYKQGMSYFATGRFKKCLKYFKNALKNKPFVTYECEIYYHIGLAYCNVEKFEKAIFPFTFCVTRTPLNINYIHERAKAHQMIEEHEKAVEDFTQVIRINPKNAHAYFRRAFSLKMLKRFAQAAADFEAAKELDPMEPKLVVNYKQLKGVQCIVLCEPGQEKTYN